MIHATYMSSEKEAAWGPTSARCEVASLLVQQQMDCEWNSELWAEYWASWLLTLFLQSLACVFQLG